MSVEKSIELLVLEMQKINEIAVKFENKVMSKRVVSEETREKIREKQLLHHERVRQSKEIEEKRREAEKAKLEAEKAKLEAEKAKLEADKAKEDDRPTPSPTPSRENLPTVVPPVPENEIQEAPKPKKKKKKKKKQEENEESDSASVDETIDVSPVSEVLRQELEKHKQVLAKGFSSLDRFFSDLTNP
jgi:hypothetical protein